jgi:ABC-2 type transport system permease protein
MRNVAAVMYREYKIRVTSMMWLFYDLTLPAFYMLIFGIGLNTAFHAGVETGGRLFSYNAFFFAGVLSMTGFGIAINASYGFFMDRDNGVFFEFLTYPMTRAEFLLGKVLFSCAITALQTVITAVIGIAALGLPIRVDMLPALLITTMVCTAGWFFFLATFALRIRRNDFYNTVINVLYFVLMFASSIFFPLDRSPLWLRVLAHANPLTWHTDVLRHLSIGAGDVWNTAWEAAAFLLFALAAFAAGARALSRVE